MDTITAAVPESPEYRLGLRLTDSVLTLQTTIRNIQQDVEAGIAPSIIMPADADENSGMVLLTLEPSSSAIQAELDPLTQRLSTCEQTLKRRGQWLPPATPPQSPEYSIIDITDLSNAIGLIEKRLVFSTHSHAPSPQYEFSKYVWEWDPDWKEFFAHVPVQDSYLYLSRWRLNEARNSWEHVSMMGANLELEDAAQLLGCWEDWVWDPMWNEWYLDVSDDEERQCVFAGRWQVDETVGWQYLGRIGS